MALRDIGLRRETLIFIELKRRERQEGQKAREMMREARIPAELDRTVPVNPQSELC